MARLGRSQPISTRLIRPRFRDLPALFKDLGAWWSMDESSGTRYDLHGDNHLAEVNGVGSVAGLLGNAADFIRANSESLDIDDSIFNADHDFTFASWVYFPASPVDYETIAGKGYNGISGWFIGYFGSTQLRFTVCGSSGNSIAATTAPATGWRHVVVSWRSSDGKARYKIDNGSWVVAVDAATPVNSSAAFQIGAGTGNHWNGPIDQSAWWNRALTDDEITELYNGGSPLTYEEIVTGVLSAARTETAAVADAETATADFASAITESVAPSDTPAATADFVSAQAESAAVADAQTAGVDFPVAQSESLAASESSVATLTFTVDRTESAAVAESSVATADFVSAITESLSLAETPTATADFVSAITESVSIAEESDAEVVGGGTTHDADLTESVAVSESSSATVDFAAAREESATIADAQTAQADFAAAITESVAPTDAPTATADFIVALTESAAPTEETDAIVGIFGEVEESLTPEDAQTSTASMGVAQTETVSAAESSVATADFSGATTETLTAAESSAATAVFSTSLTEAIAPTDIQAAAIDFAPTGVAETVAFGDECDAVVISGGSLPRPPFIGSDVRRVVRLSGGGGIVQPNGPSSRVVQPRSRP